MALLGFSKNVGVEISGSDPNVLCYLKKVRRYFMLSQIHTFTG